MYENLTNYCADFLNYTSISNGTDENGTDENGTDESGTDREDLCGPTTGMRFCVGSRELDFASYGAYEFLYGTAENGLNANPGHQSLFIGISDIITYEDNLDLRY